MTEFGILVNSKWIVVRARLPLRSSLDDEADAKSRINATNDVTKPRLIITKLEAQQQLCRIRSAPSHEVYSSEDILRA
jgi:hypothetical protein